MSKRPGMGFGGIPVGSIAEPRKRADEAERLVRSGTNPLDRKRQLKFDKLREVTFGTIADRAIPVLTQKHRNKVHIQQ